MKRRFGMTPVRMTVMRCMCHADFCRSLWWLTIAMYHDCFASANAIPCQLAAYDEHTEHEVRVMATIHPGTGVGGVQHCRCEKLRL